MADQSQSDAPARLAQLECRLAALEGRTAEALSQVQSVSWRLGDFPDRSILLQGRMAANAGRLKKRMNDLADAEFRVFSQWGEDGIIDYLVEHVDVPNHRFVEFGVETFREANCRFLLQNRNWRGLVMDGSAENMVILRREGVHWLHDLTAVSAFIDKENINQLIADAGFAGPLGILSIDLDGNDYWIWKAIHCVDPAIVICECNSVFGDRRAVTIPYDPDFRRFDRRRSGLYFGASIKALIHLGESKNYTFVRTNSTGINAFFVKTGLAQPILQRLRRVVAYPSYHRESRGEDGQLSFVRGVDRFKLIEDMDIVDVETSERLKLKDIAQPYSVDWLRRMHEIAGEQAPTTPVGQFLKGLKGMFGPFSSR